jgi:hypothetical protein
VVLKEGVREMALHTASEGITLAKKLETDSAKIYEDLAQRYIENADLFQSFIRDNKKNIAQIDRTYYGVITDAIEGGYAFNLNQDDYTFESKLACKSSKSDIITKTIGIEDKIVKFYTEAAEQSRALIADIPRVFVSIAKKREERRAKLKSLISEVSR